MIWAGHYARHKTNSHKKPTRLAAVGFLRECAVFIPKQRVSAGGALVWALAPPPQVRARRQAPG